jgi:hypothetical protein
MNEKQIEIEMELAAKRVEERSEALCAYYAMPELKFVLGAVVSLQSLATAVMSVMSEAMDDDCFEDFVEAMARCCDAVVRNVESLAPGLAQHPKRERILEDIQSIADETTALHMRVNGGQL